ncbi:MAG TPA: cupin domain-containing protein [Pseudonocardiaceae bacterium]|nr:cupin domain-containing protein [Pseudonocardiaceae bacterium]
MHGLEAFDLDELDKLAEQAQPYHQFLRRRGMSLGIYVLPAGGTDQQHPHGSDEVYVVLRGRGSLRVRDQDHEVRQGTVISVDHGEEHRFVNVAEDLHILVIFAPPDDPD